MTAEGLIRRYQRLAEAYPIRSIKDGLAEQDRAGWRALTAATGESVQVVGDDLLVTDPKRIRQAARERLATAALIKPNQAGTVTETLAALAAVREAGRARCSPIAPARRSTPSSLIWRWRRGWPDQGRSACPGRAGRQVQPLGRDRRDQRPRPPLRPRRLAAPVRSVAAASDCGPTQSPPQ